MTGVANTTATAIQVPVISPGYPQPRWLQQSLSTPALLVRRSDFQDEREVLRVSAGRNACVPGW